MDRNSAAKWQPDIEEFKKAAQPLMEWFQQSCNPHQQIIIEMSGVKLMSVEMAFPLEVPD